MKEEQTTTVRINKDSHDILRFMAYKQNRKIIDIIDDLLKDKEKPSISDKVSRALGKLK